VSSNTPTKQRPGRPATGKTKEVTKVNIPLALYKLAQKEAQKNGESYSNFAARAIQNLLLAQMQ